MKLGGRYGWGYSQIGEYSSRCSHISCNTSGAWRYWEVGYWEVDQREKNLGRTLHPEPRVRGGSKEVITLQASRRGEKYEHPHTWLCTILIHFFLPKVFDRIQSFKVTHQPVCGRFPESVNPVPFRRYTPKATRGSIPCGYHS